MMHAISGLPEAIQQVRKTLTETFDKIDRWFDKPAALGIYQPRDGGWSINEILEHITLTNHYLLLLIRKGTQKALRRAERLDNRRIAVTTDLRKLERIAEIRSFTWERPDHMVPTGKKDMPEVRSLMREQLRTCLDLLSSMGNGEGVLFKIRMSVGGLDKIDMYQWLYFLAQHARRHIRQMERNQEEWEKQHS